MDKYFLKHMKHCLGLIALVLLTASVSAQTKNSTVLIELYSSEGCDNCPIAERFMEEVMALADSTHAPVFMIDFHVDLWDRSGWKDKYSDSAYTWRLIRQAEKIGQQAVFTPMVFVNGQGGVPGSARGQIGSLIYMNLGDPYAMGVSTEAAWLGGKNVLDIKYTVDGFTDSCQIHFALVQKKVETDVTAGENTGKHLVHHNVVRKFHSLYLQAAKGTTQIPVEPGTDLHDYKLVTFVQSLRNGKVFATEELLFR
jgi:hypothetical protein